MRFRTSFASRLSSARSLALSGLLVVGAALVPAAVSAHFEGGSWPYNRSTQALVLTYDNQCQPVSDWMNIIDLAASNWTATPTVLWFNKVPNPNCVEWGSNVDVLSGWKDDPNTYAFTSNWEQDCFIVCWWDGSFEDTIGLSQVRINANNQNGSGFAGLDGFGQLEAVTHELGHSIGLGHSGFYAGESTGNYSVMDYCCLQSIDHPTQHDIDDVNTLYPFY